MGRPAYPTLSWTNTGTTSNGFRLDGNQLVGLVIPSTMVSTSVKFNMTPSLSANPVVWYPVCDSSGAAVSFTTTTLTNQYIGFSQDQIAKFVGSEAIQMVAGSSEAANQAIKLAIIPRQY